MKLARVYSMVLGWVNNDKLFYIGLGVCIVSALWIAFSAAYPLPFDEYYHVGIIQQYTHQWSPFITTQAPDASLYGDITRLPSYLFHYLMSFPLRLIELFTSSLGIQVMILRLINIVLAASGLMLFRKLLIEAKLGKGLVNAVMVAVMLLPIMPFLAAQVNYDNALLFLTPLNLLFALRIMNSKKVSVVQITVFSIVGLAASLVKYTYLPIFVTVVVIVGGVLLYRHRHKLGTVLHKDFTRQKIWVKILLVIGLITTLGLFTERHVVNVVRYHALNVSCDTVQPRSVCQYYSPWYRDNGHEKIPSPNGKQVAFYFPMWIEKTMEGFFINFTHLTREEHTQADPFGPIFARGAMLPLYFLGWTVFFAGLVVAIKKRRVIWQNRAMRLLLAVAVFYVLMLFFQNFTGFLKRGTPQAIQARYILPVLPILMVVFAIAFKQVIQTVKARAVVLILLALLYTQGGGAITYILRSDDRWYWDNNGVATSNHVAKNIISPFVYKENQLQLSQFLYSNTRWP